jgi:hypothetical protein
MSIPRRWAHLQTMFISILSPNYLTLQVRLLWHPRVRFTPHINQGITVLIQSTGPLLQIRTRTV